MPPGPYAYELLNRGQQVGFYFSYSELHGSHIIVFEDSLLKQSYFKKPRTIKVPIIHRKVIIEGTINYRICLDVSRKSQRQINILKERVC